MDTHGLSPHIDFRKFIISLCVESLFSECCSHMGGFIYFCT